VFRAVTNLELARIFNGNADPDEISTRKVHLQTVVK
jgi:hypothetical protein